MEHPQAIGQSSIGENMSQVTFNYGKGRGNHGGGVGTVTQFGVVE